MCSLLGLGCTFALTLSAWWEQRLVRALLADTVPWWARRYEYPFQTSLESFLPSGNLLLALVRVTRLKFSSFSFRIFSDHDCLLETNVIPI